MRAFLFAFLVLFVSAAGVPAADRLPGVTGLFDPAAGRRPEAGEWLEYLVSYPADPLEDNLARRLGPSRRDGGPAETEQEPRDEGLLFIQPSFEPPTTWQSLPLRLEITGLETNGLQVRLRLEDDTYNLFLPLVVENAAAPFRYDGDVKPETSTGVYRIGDTEYPVEIVRYRTPRIGMVRIGSPDLPFGIARIASGQLDLALVGMGKGEPPPFPYAGAAELRPPVGALYEEEE